MSRERIAELMKAIAGSIMPAIVEHGTVHVPIIRPALPGERVRTADDLKFMRPRRRKTDAR